MFDFTALLFIIIHSCPQQKTWLWTLADKCHAFYDPTVDKLTNIYWQSPLIAFNIAIVAKLTQVAVLAPTPISRRLGGRIYKEGIWQTRSICYPSTSWQGFDCVRCLDVALGSLLMLYNGSWERRPLRLQGPGRLWYYFRHGHCLVSFPLIVAWRVCFNVG